MTQLSYGDLVYFLDRDGNLCWGIVAPPRNPRLLLNDEMVVFTCRGHREIRSIYNLTRND